MKNVDHSYEQALIMHDNLHIHVIMNIIVTPTTFILTTHDIFCSGFDRDPEGWVAPGHQIDINDNES